MKLILSILLLFTLPAMAQMFPMQPVYYGRGGQGSAIAQTFSITAIPAGTNATSVTTTTTTTPTSSVLIAYVPDFAGFVATVGVLSDSKSNTWTQIITAKPAGASQVRGTFWYTANPTVGSSHTFTYSAGGTVLPTIYVFGFSGVNTVSVVDQTNSATSNSAGVTSIATGTITPTQNSELLITGLVVNPCTVQPTISGGGFANANQLAWTASTVNKNVGSAIYAVNQTTSAASNPTHSFPASNSTVALILCLKNASP